MSHSRVCRSYRLQLLLIFLLAFILSSTAKLLADAIFQAVEQLVEREPLIYDIPFEVGLEGQQTHRLKFVLP